MLTKDCCALAKRFAMMMTIQNIRKAFNIALEAHKNMRRKSGELYIGHPIAVARICAEEIGLGTTLNYFGTLARYG